jgi:hypothetical protein
MEKCLQFAMAPAQKVARSSLSCFQLSESEYLRCLAKLCSLRDLCYYFCI